MAGPVSYFLEDWMKRSFVSCKYYDTRELLHKTGLIVTKVLNLQIFIKFFLFACCPVPAGPQKSPPEPHDTPLQESRPPAPGGSGTAP